MTDIGCLRCRDWADLRHCGSWLVVGDTGYVCGNCQTPADAIRHEPLHVHAIRERERRHGSMNFGAWE